jgi:hypothetical protein
VNWKQFILQIATDIVIVLGYRAAFKSVLDVVSFCRNPVTDILLIVGSGAAFMGSSFPIETNRFGSIARDYSRR